MKFIAKGIFNKKGVKNNFSKEIIAENEKKASEKVYAEFGSKNKLRRREIIIDELKGAK